MLVRRRTTRAGKNVVGNPIAPAPATAAAVHIETTTRNPMRARSGSMPRPWAVSSPALRASRVVEKKVSTAAPSTAAAAARTRNAFHCASEREPSIQNITDREPSAESEEKISRFVAAERA